MKKVKVLFGMLASLAMIVGMASCSKEDDGIDNNASIIGTWGCVHSRVCTGYDGNYNDPKEDTYVGNHIIFKDDGTYSAFIIYGTLDPMLDRDGAWMKDGSILHMMGKWNILQLTNDKLIISKKEWTTGTSSSGFHVFYEEPEDGWSYYDECLLELRRQR